MAMLLFSVGDNRYVLENRFIFRIIPHVILKNFPHASPYVLGLLNFTGTPIPIIDFCQLIEQRPAKEAFNSRIIILRDPDLDVSQSPLFGLLAEKVTDILPLHSNQFMETGFYLHQFPYLIGAYSDHEGIIQKISFEKLFQYLSQELFNISKLVQKNLGQNEYN